MIDIKKRKASKSTKKQLTTKSQENCVEWSKMPSLRRKQELVILAIISYCGVGNNDRYSQQRNR